MENISIEQILKVKPPKYAIAVKTGMVILSICSLLFIFMSYFIIVTALLIVLTILVFRYFDYEYEYSLVEKELTVDKVIARARRRKGGVFDLNKLEIMAPFGSEKLLGFEGRNCRTFNYTANQGTENVYVVYAPGNNEMVRILIEPNKKMLAGLLKIAPSKTYL